MRPAQKSAGKTGSGLPSSTNCHPASMRPAQKAPENAHGMRLRDPHHPASMRAGAKSAGKTPKRKVCTSARVCSFNEAGAKSAGKLASIVKFCPSMLGFNEAGAKKRRKNLRIAPLHVEHLAGFNEAGAKSAGKLQDVHPDRAAAGQLQ